MNFIKQNALLPYRYLFYRYLFSGILIFLSLISLSTNTVVAANADDVTSSKSISFNERNKEESGFSGQQLWRSGVTCFPFISLKTDMEITNNMSNKEGSKISLCTISPSIAIRQPLGIVLIISAILGLFLRFISNRYYQLRPLVDYSVSITGLVIFSPLFIVIGIIIKKTSRGPVFYTQERVGRNGRLFNIIKFRTMHTGAESQTGPVWAGRNDMHITTFGRFLRRTHMDELPQLINVIRGEMSIIGPRPERPFFVSKFKDNIPGYGKRLSIKPGITGLAQCYHGYDETIRDVQRKLRYDIIYINRMCWMLDLRILWRTLRVSLLREEGRKHNVT